MTMPGFTAEASLYLASGSYRTGQIESLSNAVIPAFPFGSPDINISYEPPPYPEGMGFPGKLTVTGHNFASDSFLRLTINNCDAFSHQIWVRTDSFRELCFESDNFRDCFFELGGSFTATDPSCYCGGAASVTVQDSLGNLVASGGANLPC